MRLLTRSPVVTVRMHATNQTARQVDAGLLSSAPYSDGALEKRQPGVTATAQSRSTSAGSSAQDGGRGCQIDGACPQSLSTAIAPQLPNYDYPTPFIVKNTFIDEPIVRPLSLDEFLPDRRVQSCPVEPQLGLEERSATEYAEANAQQPLVRAVTKGATVLATAAADAAAAATSAAAAWRGWWRPDDCAYEPEAVAHGPMSGFVPETDSMQMNATISQSAPQVLSLAEALVEPELGSAEMPTAGSAGHRLGTCRPCAFFHKGGCENGLQCTFCHLCDAGEKKRRQKQKIAAIRETRRLV